MISLGAVGVAGAAAPWASAAPAKGGRFAVGDTAFIDVTTATLWCDATVDGVARRAWEQPRPGIDDPSLTSPVDLRAWNANMEDTETRAWLSGAGVLETQGVMGTQVIVTDRHDDWVKVIIPAQPTPRSDGSYAGVNGYPGWLPAVQVVKNSEFAAASASNPIATVTSVYAWLSRDPQGRSKTTELSFNTMLPVLEQRADAVRVLRPNGDKQWLRASDVVVRASGERPLHPTGADIVETGKKLLGIRYLWAGVSSFGFDCSGFTYTCFRHHGITLYRDANAQLHDPAGQVIESGELVPDPVADEAALNLPAWRVGDLVFFGRRRASGLYASHVGICAEAGDAPVILHSPGSSTVAKLQPLSEMIDGGRVIVGVRRFV